ncbi:hypothetical protein LUZ60_001088 [Juncus effusus]|nr:hypothetical protein LUZ60_001088 [Juncus effusus]
MPQSMLSLLPLFLIVFFTPLFATGNTIGSSLPSALNNVTTPPMPVLATSQPKLTAIDQPKPDKGVARAFLKAHNILRANFGERPLRWDKKLARFARRWAYKMRANCTLTHSPSPYGENLFIGEGHYRIDQAVDEWVKERWSYHWSSNSCNPNEMCGHFTQMIWEGTGRLGCARMKCNNATFTFFTCNYDPPGNYIGRRPILNYQKFVH